jgi:hypothetical protein
MVKVGYEMIVRLRAVIICKTGSGKTGNREDVQVWGKLAVDNP